MEINKYRESVYKIKEWAMRGNLQRIGNIFNALNEEERNFLALKNINNALKSGGVDAIKQMFVPEIPEYIRKAREKYPKAYMRWTQEDDAMLKDLYGRREYINLETGKYSKQTIIDIAAIMQRSPNSIGARLVKYLEVGQCHNCYTRILRNEPYLLTSNGELSHIECPDKKEAESLRADIDDSQRDVIDKGEGKPDTCCEYCGDVIDENLICKNGDHEIAFHDNCCFICDDCGSYASLGERHLIFGVMGTDDLELCDICYDSYK